MRQFLALLLLYTTSVYGQTKTKGVTITGVSINTNTTPPIFNSVATLPQVWGDDNECNPPGGVFDVVKHIPGDYTTANAQQANVDYAAEGVNHSWNVIVTHGNTIAPLTMLPKLVGGVMTTKCIVWTSDTPLTAGRTVCTHGMQDNVATSTDPAVRNPDCNGTGMSYQLGQTLTAIAPGAFTLANGTATNTSAYNDVASMFTIECNTTNCASVVDGAVDANGNGANHFAIYNAEIRVNSSKTCCFPVDIERGSGTAASVPSHYHFDRIWVHGDATDAGTGTQSLTDYIRINCGGNCTLSNSYGSKGIRPGAESHGVYWATAKQLKLVHNVIEGMSIGMFSGGITASVPTGASGVDIEIRRNRNTYPLPWLGNGTAGGVCGGSSCVRKNCFEQKGVVRLLYDGNICENVDNSGGQNGTLSDLNNRACTPSVCDNYAQTIQDVNYTNDVLRHGCGGLLFDANSGNPGVSGNSASTPGRNVYLGNTLLYDISVDNFSCNVSTNGIIYLGGTNHDFTVASNTRNGAGTIAHLVLAGGTGENQTGLVSGDPVWVTGCTDTSFNAGPYPFVTSLTVSGLDITYPSLGTPNATSAGCSFSNGAGWPLNFMVDHVTAVGDWYIESGNNLTVPNAVFPRGQTYQNSIITGTRGFGDPGGDKEGTTFINSFLDPTTFLSHHNVYGQRVAPTWQANHAYKLGEVAQPTGTPAHFYTVVTSGTSGGSQPAFSGTASSCVNDNTVVWQENGFRIAQTGGLPNYTEYRVLNTPISPPTTLFFPQTDFTYGSTADATSIGFQGALNSPTTGTNTCISGTPVPGINTALDLNDWHDYKLHSSSVFRNGAADGKDLGAIISDIEAAQTRTKYVCQTPCGSGPTTD